MDTDTREHRETLLRLEVRLADLARATKSVVDELETLSRTDRRCDLAFYRAALALCQLRLAHRDMQGPEDSHGGYRASSVYAG